MEGYHVPRACGFVQPIDVLRDHLGNDAGLFQRRHREVSIVGLSRRKGRIPVWDSNQ